MRLSGRQTARLWWVVILLFLGVALGLLSVRVARGDAAAQTGPDSGAQAGSELSSAGGQQTVILENGPAVQRPGAPLALVCSTPNVAITDNDPNGVSDGLVVAESGAIQDMNVSVNASHTWVGDLIFTLKHENTGTVITLMDRPGVPITTFGCSSDNVDAEFDDEGADGPVDVMCATDPAIYGMPIPEQPLSAFAGQDLSGTWTLTASDNAGGDTGTLVDWCLVPEVAGGGINLVVDDGTAEDAIGLTGGGQLLWLNRFTPSAAAFPFTLNEIQVLFRSGNGVNVGEVVDLYVFADPDGDPANGATHVASSTGVTVQVLDDFSTYPVSIPLAGPGDVLIAVVNRTAGTDPGEFPAAIDTTASQGRSWVGFYDGNPADPPVLPATTFGTIDSFGFPGNWMIRGLGTKDSQAYLPLVVKAATGQPAGGVTIAPPAPAAGGAGKQAGPADGAPTGLEIVPAAAPEAVAIENGQADPRTGAPVALWRVNYAARGETVEAQARDYLSANAAALHLRSADLADLVFDGLREGPSGATVRFDQVAAGVPVYDAQIAVHVSPAGLVTYVTSSYQSDVSLAEATPALAPVEARQALIDHLGATGAFRYDETTLAVHPDGGGRLVYVVRIVADQPMGDWEALVDAHSGALLQVADRYLDVDGTGNVFDPDPLSSAGASYGDPGFVDNNDATSPQLDGERVSKTLLDITFDGAQYTLVGPYAEIRDSEGPFYGLFPEADGVWDYNRFDNGFEAAHTYYHIDAVMRYINETLAIAVAPIQYAGGARFDAHGLNGADNSHYSSATGEVAFGEGGVDDAEDADVVVHELGHAIHDWVTNGNLSQVQGLSEGTGDYVAASYSRSFGQWTLGDPQYYWVFDWDGHNPFWPGRVTNWPAHYPEGLTGQIHTDGQIWSTSLMRIWDDIGGERIDAAVLEGLGMTGASTNQDQAANAVMQAAIDMGYTTPELQAMYNSFTTTGYNVPPPAQVAPEIEVNPDVMTQTLTVGATATQALDIINSGDADLTWEIIEEAPPTAAAAPPASSGGTVERLGPTPPNPNPAEYVPTDDVIQDGGFEAGSPNPFWTEFSTNFFTPLCTIADCGTGGGTGPRSGTWWAWFGGIEAYEEGSLSQDVTMPEGTATLSFWLEVPVCDSAADYLEVLIDGTQVFVTDGDDPLCGVIGYSEQTVDVSAYADGGVHTVEFHSETFANNADVSNFFVDDVVLDVVAGGGACTPGDITWVSANPTSGTAAAGETDTVNVAFDATGLSAGVYTGTLCVESNDDDEPIITVPLTLTVEEAPPGYNLYLPVVVNAATGQPAGSAPIAPAAALLAPFAALFVSRRARR